MAVDVQIDINLVLATNIATYVNTDWKHKHAHRHEHNGSTPMALDAQFEVHD